MKILRAGLLTLAVAAARGVPAVAQSADVTSQVSAITAALQHIDSLMRRFFVLHARMQAFFRAWHVADAGSVYAQTAANVVDVDVLRRLQASLGDPPLDDERLRARLDANFALLEAFARTWQAVASAQYPALDCFVSPAADGAGTSLDITPLRVALSRLPA